MARYEGKDTEHFFGRAEVVGQVIAAVTGGGSSRLTDVFGASGIGKSWLVNAACCLRCKRSGVRVALLRAGAGARPVRMWALDGT
ncbi:hypothetical protein ACFWBR_30205 [Streptomyces sp. NPDC060006]|uniref:nSTAND1 domain-containing NTPase n=1 Tax=unclassified Streptomyces TaxID=2593676 RepID=UPI00369C601D